MKKKDREKIQEKLKQEISRECSDVEPPDERQVIQHVQLFAEQPTKPKKQFRVPRKLVIVFGTVLSLAIFVMAIPTARSWVSTFVGTITASDTENGDAKYYIKGLNISPVIQELGDSASYLYELADNHMIIREIASEFMVSSNKPYKKFMIDGISIDGATYADCHSDEDAFNAFIYGDTVTLYISYDGSSEEEFISLIKNLRKR